MSMNSNCNKNCLCNQLSQLQTITGTITSVENTIIGQLSNSTELDTLTGIVSNKGIIRQRIPQYEGVYEVTPVVGVDLLLETANKKMTDDLIVNEIPYFETTNPSGGYTVIIG